MTSTTAADMLTAIRTRHAAMITNSYDTNASDSYRAAIENVRITRHANGDITATGRGTHGYVAGYVLDVDTTIGTEWDHIVEDTRHAWRLVRNCPCAMTH